MAFQAVFLGWSRDSRGSVSVADGHVGRGSSRDASLHGGGHCRCVEVFRDVTHERVYPEAARHEFRLSPLLVVFALYRALRILACAGASTSCLLHAMQHGCCSWIHVGPSQLRLLRLNARYGTRRKLRQPKKSVSWWLPLYHWREVAVRVAHFVFEAIGSA